MVKVLDSVRKNFSSFRKNSRLAFVSSPIHAVNARLARKLTSENEYVSVSVLRERSKKSKLLQHSLFRIKDVIFDRNNISWIAGPEYVESVRQLYNNGHALSSLGSRFLRAKAYWPNAKSTDFQRHLRAGLRLLFRTAKHFNLFVCSEIVFRRDLPLMVRYCDIIEFCPTGMQDADLLKDLATCERGIILRRRADMPIEEFLGLVSIVERNSKGSIALAEEAHAFKNSDRSIVFDFSSAMRMRKYTSYSVFVDCSGFPKECFHPEKMLVEAYEVGVSAILASFDVAKVIGNSPLDIQSKEEFYSFRDRLLRKKVEIQQNKQESNVA